LTAINKNESDYFVAVDSPVREPARILPIKGGETSEEEGGRAAADS
jgi:hypothetical protein